MDVVYDLVRARLQEGYKVSQERLLLTMEAWLDESIEAWTALGVFDLDGDKRVVSMITTEGTEQDAISSDEDECSQTTDSE